MKGSVSCHVLVCICMHGVLYLWKLHPKCNTDENIWIMAILLRIHNLVNIIARYFKILWKISILSPNHYFNNILNKSYNMKKDNWIRDQLNPYYKYMWITKLWDMKIIFFNKTQYNLNMKKYIERKRWVKIT